MLFPVFERPDPQKPNNRRRYHEVVSFKTRKDLKTACSKYGLTSPFSLALLDTIGSEATAPKGWIVLAEACLRGGGGDYLMWKSDWYEESSQQADRN